MAKTVTITISDGKTSCEFYGVPVKTGNAIRTLLEECENNENDIVSCTCEVRSNND